MDALVFFVVLLAAVLHAGWSALVKNAGDKYVSMTAIVLGHAPPAVLALPFVPLPDPPSWPYVLDFRRWGILSGIRLVVWAFTQAPIPLVTALRETSIIFALLIGVLFLNERLNLVKVASTAMTLFGAVLLRFSR